MEKEISALRKLSLQWEEDREKYMYSINILCSILEGNKGFFGGGSMEGQITAVCISVQF